MSPRPAVVGLGLCVMDHLYRVASLDPGADRLRYTQRLHSAGGMIGNALVQVARLGCDAHVLSVVGDDADGRRVRRALREAGVKARGLRLDPDRPSTVAVVLVHAETGARRFVVPDRRALERGVADFDLAALRPGRVLLVDGHFPAQARRAVRRARSLGIPVVADFSEPRPEFVRLLPWVDYPVVPLEFARRFAPGPPAETLRRLRGEYGGTPVVTLGARGGVYLDGGRVRRWRARPVRVRDTTGAGDAFHGAFAAGLALGLGLRPALELAAHAGAVCCTAFGASTRQLTRAEAAIPDSRAGAVAREARGRGPRDRPTGAASRRRRGPSGSRRPAL